MIEMRMMLTPRWVTLSPDTYLVVQNMSTSQDLNKDSAGEAEKHDTMVITAANDSVETKIVIDDPVETVKMKRKTGEGQECLTVKELDDVTTVFRQYEIGLRGGCIDVKDLHPALESLGLKVMEQEVIDMTNAIARDGLVFFPEFCSVCLRKLREEDEEQFAQIVFKVMIFLHHSLD